MSMSDPPLLSVEGLTTTVSVQGRQANALEDVSFTVRKGECVAIVGESGSGKSMTALAIMGLLPEPQVRATAGSIRFGGTDLLTLNQERMRAFRGDRISMIFQEPMTSLNPVFTIGHQISEPLIYHKGLSRKAARKKAAQLLSQVQVADAEHRLSLYPHQFSGGMRQRAMIATGLACDPELMIADEPTTALDVTIQAQILEILRELARGRGMGLILITHSLGVVARYADTVIVMYAGRVVESGPVAEVFGRPKHPYTRGLMACVPTMDGDLESALVPIDGQPSGVFDRPSGCAFHPRCPLAFDRCRTHTPPLDEYRPGHHKACWADA